MARSPRVSGLVAQIAAMTRHNPDDPRIAEQRAALDGALLVEHAQRVADQIHPDDAAAVIDTLGGVR